MGYCECKEFKCFDNDRGRISHRKDVRQHEFEISFCRDCFIKVISEQYPNVQEEYKVEFTNN